MKKARWFSYESGINTALFFIILYFLHFAIKGENGIISLIQNENKLKTLQDKLSALENKKKLLISKNRGLHLATLDLDILEEESKKIGYLDSSEIIVLIDKN
jgi:hypothetical protein